MSNETYVKTEVVGTSSMSVSDAIASAIATASRSLRNLEWFEVVSVRGKISDNEVVNYQVTLTLGCCTSQRPSSPIPIGQLRRQKILRSEIKLGNGAC